VLLRQVVEYLAPRPGGVYCDATVGYGGHARAVLDASAPSGRLIGLDRDPNAIAEARGALAGYGDRVTLIQTPFSRLREALDQAGAPPLDGCLVDLGVSSPQLDRAERGFSFRRSGPLDMRMDPTSGPTAAEYLRQVDEAELEAVLRDFGEERHARRLARAIVEARAQEPLDTTGALAALVARTIGRHERKDPATRTFQALRIRVNRELEELEAFLDEAPRCLRPGGRLVVIAFHSLEDRIAKRRLRALAGKDAGAGQPPILKLLNKHVVVADDEERARNPRARSAHLRAVERLPS
jgi:16S rRNA (cytosine1402-N4)-methyltransferase